MAANLRDEGFIGFESGDELIELLKEGQGRSIFTPAKQDAKLEEILRRAEDEWIEQQLANLEEEGIDGERSEKSSGDILPVLRARLQRKV
jgi:hypothetical protein